MKLYRLAGRVILVLLYLFLLHVWLLAGLETIKNGTINDSILNYVLFVGVCLFILWRIWLSCRKETGVGKKKERANKSSDPT